MEISRKIKSLRTENRAIMETLDFSARKVLMASLLVSGIFVGGAATYLGLNMDQVTAEQAGEKVVSTLEKQTGQQLELAGVKEENGLYRVNVVGSNNQLQTYYVTKNGKMATTRMTDLDQVNNLLDAREDFKQCLVDKNVIMYGNASQVSTARQIQVFGGVQYLPTYKDINSRENLVEALNRGITTMPAFYYNGSALEGVKGLGQLQQFTGCQFQVEQ